MTLFGTDFPDMIEWLAHAARDRCGGLLGQGGPSTAESAEWIGRRDYSPGDDYRSIDWRVCARHDELVSRQRPPCPNRCVHLLVDGSRSMSTGRPPKFDLARQIAAALGTAALGHLDQVTVLAFADRIVARLPRIRGSSHLSTLLRFLESLTPDGTSTDLASTAECLVRRSHPPGLAVVIGDFFEPECYRRGLEILRHHGHTPCLVHVCSRSDAEPEMLGDVELHDVETGLRTANVVGRRELAQYRRLFEEFRGSVRAFCRQRGIGYLSVREDTSWERMLFELTGLNATVRPWERAEEHA